MTLLAFECDAGLRIAHVWRGEAIACGSHLLDLFEAPAAPAAAAFLAELSSLGFAAGRSIEVQGTALRFAACAREERALVIAAERDADAVEWLAAMDDPRARLLRRWFETLATSDAQETHRLYAELSQVNNELSTLHRELAIQKRELERANIRLEQQALELMRLNEEKNRFIGIAAHDLRNPIGCILVFAENILDLAQPDAETMSLASEIALMARGMTSLVNEILDVSAIEAGTFRLDLAPVDLNDAASRSVAMLRHQAARKSIELRLEKSPEAAIVRADAGKIDQLLNNLVSNALKFSYPGEPVDVVVRGEARECVVEVRDRGVGIAPDEQSRLFRPFEKLSSKSTSGEPNTGLGLAIVRKIIDAHAGRIEVASEPGAGSTFTIRLPSIAADDQDAVVRSSPAASASGTSR